MKKLFRFKYEPCNGTCYAWCDTLTEELLRHTEADRIQIVSKMVEAHNRLCDNPDFSFGVDLEVRTHTFVSYFKTPTFIDTMVSTSFKDIIDQVTNKVFNTEIPIVYGECNFGTDGSEDLGKEILKACSDIAYREKHHANCPCHKVA